MQCNVKMVVGIVDISLILIKYESIQSIPDILLSNKMCVMIFFQVTNMLEKLDNFLKRIEPEIEGITGEERDTASFMKMMRLFNEVCKSDVCKSFIWEP